MVTRPARPSWTSCWRCLPTILLPRNPLPRSFIDCLFLRCGELGSFSRSSRCFLCVVLASTGLPMVATQPSKPTSQSWVSFLTACLRTLMRLSSLILLMLLLPFCSFSSAPGMEGMYGTDLEIEALSLYLQAPMVCMPSVSSLCRCSCLRVSAASCVQRDYESWSVCLCT